MLLFGNDQGKIPQTVLLGDADLLDLGSGERRDGNKQSQQNERPKSVNQ
jgi:hypothetical protein